MLLWAKFARMPGLGGGGVNPILAMPGFWEHLVPQPLTIHNNQQNDDVFYDLNANHQTDWTGSWARTLSPSFGKTPGYFPQVIKYLTKSKMLMIWEHQDDHDQLPVVLLISKLMGMTEFFAGSFPCVCLPGRSVSWKGSAFGPLHWLEHL